MGEVRGVAAQPVGYDSDWMLELTGGVAPERITTNDDSTVTLTFPDDVPAETLTAIKRRMEAPTDAAADLVSQLCSDYAANEARMPFTNNQIQALTEQMQRVIRLVTGT